jgi:LysR family hydrogen peroxide-inducible transcriptional activator
MVTFTQLEYIVAVDRLGNFRQAAKACHVTQPTLSMQIQKLEDELGVVIFDRSRQPIRATPIGQAILEQSRIALSQTSRITAIVAATKEAVEGELRLGVIPTLAPYLLPLFLDRFAKSHPKARLLIEESKTDDIIAALQRDRLDVGLLATPLGEPSIVEHRLFLEPFYVYAAKDSPLAALSEVSDVDLRNEKVLLLAEGHCLREQIVRVCRYRRGKGPQPGGFEFESGSIETLCRLVERGHGYTIIPHLAKASGASHAGRVVPFSEPRPSREVSLVVHQSFAREAMLRALAEAIRQALPRELRQADAAELQTIKLR